MHDHDMDASTVCADPVNIRHHTENVIQVFQNVVAANRVECAVLEWKRGFRQITDNINRPSGEYIDADTTVGVLISTTEIQRSVAH
jgi:hypothetical protein